MPGAHIPTDGDVVGGILLPQRNDQFREPLFYQQQSDRTPFRSQKKNTSDLQSRDNGWRLGDAQNEHCPVIYQVNEDVPQTKTTRRDEFCQNVFCTRKLGYSKRQLAEKADLASVCEAPFGDAPLRDAVECVSCGGETGINQAEPGAGGGCSLARTAEPRFIRENPVILDNIRENPEFTFKWMMQRRGTKPQGL